MKYYIILLLLLYVSNTRAADSLKVFYDFKSNSLIVHEDENILSGFESQLYKFNKNDKILISVSSQPGADSIIISYEITGTDPYESIKSDLSDTISGLGITNAKADSAKYVESIDTSGTPTEIKTASKAVTDNLFPGGNIKMSFKQVKDSITIKKEFMFSIVDENPWFFSSLGFAVSAGREGELALINTNKKISEAEYSKTFQRINMKNNENDLKPIQSIITFLNFRLSSSIYFSIGAPINNKIFDELMLGLSIFSRYNDIGFSVTAGVQFNQELQIQNSSGYKVDQYVDPADGLTLDSIPTETKTKLRPFVGISFKL